VKRTLYGPEHEAFREMVRAFIAKEVVPEYPTWLEEGAPPWSFFQRLGELGIMGMNMPAEFGGSGEDFRYNAVLQEEAGRAAVVLGSVRTHLDVVLPYFRRYADRQQQERWFPGICAGDLMTSIALTEPDTGSDLAGVRTIAVRHGDSYLLNGAKTYITGGSVADLVIMLCRTATDPANRRNGLTLLVVEDGMPGFAKGRKLPKIGLKAQDTVELSFDDVVVPVANRLGEEGQAFGFLGVNLPQERLAIAVGSVAQSRAALDLTIEYVKDRRVFGQSLSSFQNTKFELATLATDLEAAQVLLDRAIEELVAGELTPGDAAKVKPSCTELQGRVMDRSLQLHGGFCYITESVIARLYTDARVSRIYGGTSEVMKSIIGKSLGLS